MKVLIHGIVIATLGSVCGLLGAAAVWLMCAMSGLSQPPFTLLFLSGLFGASLVLWLNYTTGN